MSYYKFPDRSDIPFGYCQCGCGEKTALAKQTDTARGYIKGRPNRFVNGHQNTSHTLADIFWQHVTPADKDACWIFDGRKSVNGYGLIRYQRRVIFAHRASWEVHHGAIPDGLFSLHKCDNPPCCNPNHLFLGTQADNNADMLAKGRKAVGETMPQSKLKEPDIVKIRQLAADGLSGREIGLMFNINSAHIWGIVARKYWKHVP